MRKNIVIAITAVLLIAVAIVSNASKDTLPTEAAAKVGYLAPNFELETLDGGEYQFDHSQLSKPVLINFWASWCSPCISEAPALAELHQKYKDRVEFIAVNVTTWEFKGTDKATEFVQEHNLQMSIPLDEDGDIIKLYNVIGVPVTVLVDQNGVIEHIYHGEFQPEDLDNRLAKL